MVVAASAAAPGEPAWVARARRAEESAQRGARWLAAMHLFALTLHSEEFHNMSDDPKFHADLVIGDASLKVEFDFGALAELHAKLSGKHPVHALNDALEAGDVSLLLDMAALGLRIHHPDLTREWIAARRVSVQDLARAVARAFGLAWWGPQGAPTPDQAPDQAA